MNCQRFFAILLTALFLAACATPVTPKATATPTRALTGMSPPIRPSVVWPTDSWPISSLEEQGIDAESIKRIQRSLELGTYGYIDRFMLIRNGYVVADEYYEHDYERINEGRDPTSHPYNYYHPDWHPYYQGSDLHTLQSVTKSVISVVIGIAIQRGELSGTGVKVIDYFEDYELQNLDERKRRITLEDLLTMRSGLDWDEWAYPFEDSRNIATQMEASNDWIQFVLDRPMAHDPGEVWSYSSGASQLLSVVFKKATGFFIDEYAEEHLFRPLGITEYYWKKTPKGWPDTEGGLYLKAEDLAKIGYLILREGVWEGNQIVSTEWVEESTSPKVYDIFPQDPVWDWGYGYQWWSIDVISSEMPRIVFAPGYGGQYLFIVPELDLLAVFNSWNIYGTQPSLIDLFIQRIAPAVE